MTTPSTPNATNNQPKTEPVLFQAVYASAATDLFDSDELLKILEKSRTNNERANITGILLYKDGNFMQVLEGDENKVLDLLETISNDSRHRSVLKLVGKPVKKRDFSDWSMAFRDLSKIDVNQFPGYNDFLNTPLISPEFQGNDTLIRKLISNFAQISR